MSESAASEFFSDFTSQITKTSQIFAKSESPALKSLTLKDKNEELAVTETSKIDITKTEHDQVKAFEDQTAKQENFSLELEKVSVITSKSESVLVENISDLQPLDSESEKDHLRTSRAGNAKSEQSDGTSSKIDSEESKDASLVDSPLRSHAMRVGVTTIASPMGLQSKTELVSSVPSTSEPININSELQIDSSKEVFAKLELTALQEIEEKSTSHVKSVADDEPVTIKTMESESFFAEANEPNSLVSEEITESTQAESKSLLNNKDTKTKKSGWGKKSFRRESSKSESKKAKEGKKSEESQKKMKSLLSGKSSRSKESEERFIFNILIIVY